MADTSLFNISPSSLTLGAVLARSSPRTTLYQADLQLGTHVTKVCLTLASAPESPANHRLNSLQFTYATQVAVNRLHSGSDSAAAEAMFLEQVQTLQLASASCHRACRTLGCCKVDGDACIVMTLYPKSAAKRLEECQGW